MTHQNAISSNRKFFNQRKPLFFSAPILALAAAATLFLLMLSGCDGGGGSGAGGEGPRLNEGIFVDSPVAGLNYQSETQSGVTDAEGTFHYMSGETIRFSIGDVVLGEAPAEALMTPLHLAGESVDEVSADNPVVVNMIRFIQSLDADHDPENGITLTDAVRSEVSGRMIDFHQSVHDFENDARVTAMFDAMNGLNMPHASHAWDLHDTDDALSHMTGYMDRHMGDWADAHMGPWMDEWMDGHRNGTNGRMPGHGDGPMMGR